MINFAELSRLYPRPTVEEEKRLAKLSRAGDAKAMERLALSHAYIAKRAADRALPRNRPDRDDIIQIALQAILEAAKVFNEDLGRFSSYAPWHVRRRLSHYYMKDCGKTLSYTNASGPIGKLLRRPSLALDIARERNPYVAERLRAALALKTGASDQEIARVVTYAYTAYYCQSLDRQVGDGSETLGAFVGKHGGQEGCIMSRQMRTTIRAEMERLSGREREVIDRLFFKGETARAIAEGQGVTGEMISHIKKRACRRLRVRLSSLAKEVFGC